MKKLLYTLLLLSGLCANAQDTPNPAGSKLLEIVAALDSFRNKVPVEKVHIHFDKPYYTLGDTIWMKAYVVNENNELTALSKILYADFIDDKDSVKVSLRLPVTAGLAWGAITLTDSLLQNGNYHIRAYTNLMRNFGHEYFFNKTISIGDDLPAGVISPSSALPFSGNAALKKDSAGISVQFFPEGGELVAGLPSKIAFKATGIDGLGREVSGYIADQDKQQVVTFQSEHVGMGAFVLQPVAGSTYTAIIKFKDNTEKRVQLPKIAQQGYNLSIAQNPENIIVKITASSSLLNTGEILLVAQANNAVQYTGAKQLSKSSFTAILAKKRFPEGILQFTLFSADKKPVAERLVFIRHTDQHLKINVKPDKANYKQRDKAHLNLEVTDQQGQPVVGVFSLAITDEGKVPYTEADEKTIFSNLLLTADLKGFIEHPNYYFTDTTTGRQQQLDNLLLTQGWRRFIWKDILASDLPPLAYQSENGMGISGKVLDNKGKPVPGAKVHLLVSEGEGLLLDTVADALGRFNFDDLAFAKGIKFNVAATDAKGKKNVTVEMNKDKSPLPPVVEHIPDELPGNINNLTANQENIKNESLTGRANTNAPRQEQRNPISLNEVEINEKRAASIKELAVKNSANLAGPGNADQVLTFVDLANCGGNLAGCLISRLSNVQITPTRMGSWVAISRGLAMKVLVDGQPRDPSTVLPNDIASVEVLRGGGAATLYNTTGGVILITTKRGGVDYNKYIREDEDNRLKSIALKEIVIKDTKKAAAIQTIATKNSTNLAGAGNADQVLTFVDLIACQYSLAECLQGRLTNVVVKDGNAFARNFDTPMYIIVDGVPGRDLSSIMSSDVASVEVLRGGGAASLYGSKGGNGVLIITTKRGDINYDSYTPGYRSVSANKPALINYKFQSGYDLRRQFYSPNYDNPATNKQQADLRTTIYWNPNIITDENGKASVEFFNADGTGNYKVITEGLSLEGKLGREVYRYMVK